MNILKYLLPCIALLFFITTGVLDEHKEKKKHVGEGGKEYHEKMWEKKGKWKKCPMKNKFGQCPMMGKGPPPMMGMGGSFSMIESQGRLFLYNKINGDVWVCNAFKKTCEQIVVENKDIE